MTLLVPAVYHGHVVAHIIRAIDLVVGRVVAEGVRLVACRHGRDDAVGCAVNHGHVGAAVVRAVNLVFGRVVAEGIRSPAGRYGRDDRVGRAIESAVTVESPP